MLSGQMLKYLRHVGRAAFDSPGKISSLFSLSRASNVISIQLYPSTRALQNVKELRERKGSGMGNFV